MAWSTHKGIWQSKYTEFLKRTSKNVWKHEKKMEENIGDNENYSEGAKALNSVIFQ